MVKIRPRSKTPLILPLFIMTSLAWAVVCEAAHTPSNTNPNRPGARQKDGVDYASLLEKLRARGLKADAGDEITQPFFSVKGKTISVGGETLQVFEYRRESDAAAQARRVDPRGRRVGTTMVNWVDAPHFYTSGKLIVLYVGNNADVKKALEDAIGPQFAGSQ